MRRYLVVAHKTIGGEHLLDEVRRRLEEGRCHFHLLVPRDPGRSTVRAYSESQLNAEAEVRLEEAITRFEELGADVSGEVGDENPVYAIDTVFRRAERDNLTYDEILLSTFPQGLSRWLRLDVPSRVAREFAIPVTHLVAERKKTSTGSGT